MIKIKAKRIFDKTDLFGNVALIEIAGLKNNIVLPIPLEVYHHIDQRTLKNYIKNEIYSQMEVEIYGQ